MKKMGTMEIVKGKLQIGGMDLEDLAKEYQTPLYIMDEAHFEQTARIFTENFQSKVFQGNVLYASKAFTNIYLVKKVKELGLCLDVVSGGELYTALKAGLDPQRIYFHGNNKLAKELEYATEAGVGRIIIDNQDELTLLLRILEEKKLRQEVLLRVNPGVAAHTHEYIQTTNEKSKFGLSIHDEGTKDVVRQMVASEWTDFRGIHCHIGSQVFEEESFFKSADLMIGYAKELEDELGIPIKELNLGGGFGVYYTPEDKPFELGAFLRRYVAHIEESLSEAGLEPESVDIEPGRSLINGSGSTLYRIGSIKHPMKGDPFLLVDGGMTDNPRPAMYQAKYEAGLVSRPDAPPEQTYTIAGRACESGDVLITGAKLPKAQVGELLIVPNTGAYTYSMSSNYNRIERPAVVFVKDGRARVAVKRETYADLIRNDVE